MSKCFCHFNGYEVKDSKARPYKTISEMKANTNLVAGNIVRTIGYYEANDGGGATYLIREKQETDIEDLGSIHFIGDSLVAELIIEDMINVKCFGAKLDGITDDTNSFINALNNENIILPKNSVVLLNNLEIPSNRIIDFNNSIVKTSSSAIKQSSLSETEGYNYRKNINIKNIIFDLEENQKGIELYNTIETTIENICVNDNLPSNSYVIYYANCFNLTFKDVYISGTENTYNENSYGIYGLSTEGGIAGTYNLTNMKFKNILIQRVENGITFDWDNGATWDTIDLENIGFSRCNKGLNITDNLDHQKFKTCKINTLRCEYCNYGIYNNGCISTSNIHLYNCTNAFYNIGRVTAYEEIEITGNETNLAIYNSGNLDLSNCYLSSSKSYQYELGTNIKNAKTYGIITNSSSQLSWITDYPDPVDYNLNFTGSQIYLSALPTEIRNNLHINVLHENTIQVYTTTGIYYDVKENDYLELIYMNNKWYIKTSGSYINTNS